MKVALYEFISDRTLGRSRLSEKDFMHRSTPVELSFSVSNVVSQCIFDRVTRMS